MDNKENKERRLLVGQVLSDKMDKTVVVRVERTFMHSKFYKTIRRFKKYKVHDEREIANTGDIVEFFEGRPHSKTKYMYLARVVKAAKSVNE
jgi:small subunit ribosomal protein S17